MTRATAVFADMLALQMEKTYPIRTISTAILIESENILRHHPLTSPLDILIEKSADIVHHEAADVEAEKLSSMASAELKAYLGFIGMTKSGVFHLSSNLV